MEVVQSNNENPDYSGEKKEKKRKSALKDSILTPLILTGVIFGVGKYICVSIILCISIVFFTESKIHSKGILKNLDYWQVLTELGTQPRQTALSLIARTVFVVV